MDWYKILFGFPNLQHIEGSSFIIYFEYLVDEPNLGN